MKNETHELLFVNGVSYILEEFAFKKKGMSLAKVISQWSIDGFHRPFAVQCSPPVGETKYHFVFTLPKRFLRHRATTFQHFRTSYESKNMQVCFHFFLDFMEAMVSESKSKKEMQPKGKNTIGFVEWCPSSDSKRHLDTAGWRFHVFVDREVNELRVLETLLGNFRKQVQRLSSKGKPVPHHYLVNTMASYGSKVFEVYGGVSGNIEQLYQNLSEGCSTSPSSLFKMKEIEGSLYTLDMYRNETDEFVFPSHNFFRLDTESLSSKFCQKYLPDHVMFSFAKPEIRVVHYPFKVELLPHRYYRHYEITNENALEEFIEENGDKYIVSEASTTYRNVFQIGEVNYSTIKKTHDVWLNTKDIDDMEGEASAAYEKMNANQHDISTIDHITLSAMDEEDKNDFIEQEFMTHVWNDPDCFASEPIKAVVRWFKREYDYRLIKPFRLVHDKMSVFGHRACIVMEMYHHLYQMSSAHRACYWVHIARLDAFRHQHNLHLNCVFTGDAATSKSYVIETMIRNSISRTVSTRTYDTDKSDAIDSDKNHMVHAFDEAPPGFFKDPKKRGPLEALKMKLTTMKTSHRRLWTNEETGEREQIESVSSNIGCLMGATNESRSAFDNALVTRFHFFEAEKALNTSHSVANCQHASETMGDVQRQRLKSAIMFHKFEQGYVALVWQYVRMGRLREPNKTAVGVLTRRFNELLKADYDIEIESRTIERIKRISQNLAIVRAKQILYHTVTGKYANVPFHPRQLVDAERYMICTEEIVMHAIGLEFDTVVSRNRRKVLGKVWMMHKENEMYKQDDKGDDNVNYIQIPGNIYSISKRLLNALMEDNVHVSSCNIQTVFEEIKDQTLNCFGYTNDSDYFGDGLPGYDSEKKRWSAYEEFGGNIYLHLDLFKDLRSSRDEKNIYKLTLEKMVHKYTREKVVVLGMNNFSYNDPKTWDTVHMKPNPEKEITMSHGIGKVEDVYDILGYTEDLDMVLTEDLDDYVAYDHSQNVGYEVETYVPQNQDWASRLISYPHRKNKRKR